MRSRERLNTLYSTTTRSLAIKRGKMVTYYEGRSFIKSRNPLNTLSFEIKGQIKKRFIPLPQCLKSPKLAVWWPSVKDSQPQSHMTILTSAYVR